MNEIVRCRDCGKPINRDQQNNFFSLCYECFRRFKSSKMKKAFALKLIGGISLPIVILNIIILSMTLGYMRLRPIGISIFTIGSIIAITIPSLLIIFGIKRNKEWKTSFVEKSIIKRPELITTTSPSKNSTHVKYCPECGKKIVNVNQKFCVNCGTEI